MKFSSLSDFILQIPEIDKCDFSESNSIGNGLCKNNCQLISSETGTIKKNNSYFLEYLNRIRVENQELTKIAFDETLENIRISMINVIRSYGKKTNDELSEILSYFIVDKLSSEAIRNLFAFVKPHLGDNLLSNLIITGDREMLNEFLPELQNCSYHLCHKDSDDRRISIEIENTCFSLDLDRFKSYLRTQFGLESVIERVG